jgi:hypothetical protein
MKNNILKITISVFLIGSLFSCEDFLDKRDSQNLTEEEVFNDPIEYERFCNNMFTFLRFNDGGWACTCFGGFGRIGYSSFEGATDLAESSRDVSGTNAGFNMGNWSTSTLGVNVELLWPWKGAYKGIRICNIILETVNDVPGMDDAKRNSYYGEALFLRAFYHFEMIKRYGGVPYVKHSFEEDDDMNLERNTYSECVEYIIQDVEEALAYLPENSTGVNFGRPNQGAAKALKAKALIYHASPLNTEPYQPQSGTALDESYHFVEKACTPDEIQARWIRAAKACWDVIKMGQYTLMPANQYAYIFHTNSQPEELIFPRIDGSVSFYGGSRVWNGWINFADWGASQGYGGNSGTYPTQNFVDMFEMADGSIPILGYKNGDGTQPIINPKSVYSEENMWENRDPRLKKFIIHNQMVWQKRPAELWIDANNPNVTGTEMKDVRDYTRTGYLNKKFWPETVAASDPSKSETLNWIFIRYAEVLLWYAEAMNHAFGPNIDGLGYGKTALDALNEIRMRVRETSTDKEACKLSKTISQEDFHERLMNERAVEFFMEEVRWWDVIRYKKGTEVFNQPIYGIRPLRTSKDPLKFRLERRKLEGRTFYDFMHKYPIPFSQIEKSSKLKQNPGW